MPKGRRGIDVLKSFFTGNKPVPVEKQFFNPLDAKISTHVRLTNVMAEVNGEKDVELDGELFKVTEIWAWERSRHGNNLEPFADYHLDSGDIQVALRVFSPTTKGGSPTVLLLTQHWPEGGGIYPWGEDSPFILGLENPQGSVMDPSGELFRHQGTPQEECYFRDLCNAHCRVSRIRDKNQDGEVEIEEVEKLNYSLWTYRRDTKDEVGQDFTQHLHVQLGGFFDEKSKKITEGDRSIQMFRGESVPPESMMVY